ncbi:GNAT family N-acetyltransferase [Spirillospora albida]|uniref:GNAT family N-acetyltransferase n=1 Tax=Spirillospora albida TaxID=58123 RepID=UPI0004C1956A|nr:GNAT family N-acetyltransferase [Spirillospora albida]
MLREATDADREMVREWRNHPEVRRVSLTTHRIGADEHRRWWDAVGRDPSRRTLIYERAGTPAGVVNFFDHDRDAATAAWGIYLDIEGLGHRSGDLMGAWMELEREAVRYAFGPMGVRRLWAEVLADNAAVRWLHRRHGFRETGARERLVDGEPRQVIRVELCRQDG